MDTIRVLEVRRVDIVGAADRLVRMNDLGTIDRARP
jgi:hypothetical protein